MISFREVRVHAGERQLLGVAALDLAESRISVIGPNGGGKSTLLQLVNGLIEPSEGTVETDGLDTIAQGSQVRQRTGFVFSNPAAQLVMPTPVEDVELSLRHRVKDRAARRARALACLADLGIEDLAEQSSHELSGGQQQLVALATVLVLRPRVLLLDEPTTLLDLTNARRFIAVVDRLAQASGIQVITATHDLELAATAERTLLIDGGAVVADDVPGRAIGLYRDRCDA